MVFCLSCGPSLNACLLAREEEMMEEERQDCLPPFCYDTPDSHSSGQPHRAAPLASPQVSRPYVFGKGRWQMLSSLEE